LAINRSLRLFEWCPPRAIPTLPVSTDGRSTPGV
jgi:hypothetical protein